jgi:hypothetical protein
VSSFHESLAALAKEAGAFAHPKLARVQELLAEADALLAEVRSSGIELTVVQPYSRHAPLAGHRFEIWLSATIPEGGSEG